jgi:5-(hydroxymethyl)furfural/furfural oxidase
MNTSTQLLSSSFGAIDYLVIGGGSAGCALASRLSADPSVRVVLLEAGRDFLPDREPDQVRDVGMRAHFNPEFLWPGLLAQNMKPTRAGEAPFLAPFLQARVVGGGSAINGMHAQRGAPADYDEWERFGVKGWSWSEVLDTFKQVETDRDFSGSLHGDSGPLEIERIPESDWGPLSLATRTVLQTRGIPKVEDLNAEFGEGVGAVPLNIRASARMSAAQAFLTADVRKRPNLAILDRVEVVGLRAQGTTIVGADFKRNGASGRLSAAETILCSGAIHTPLLMLRSGIGPARELRPAGIEVIADRSGVGKNLLNHPMLIVSAHLRASGRRARRIRPPCVMLARYSSHIGDVPDADMLLNVYDRSFAIGSGALSSQIGHILLIANKIYSTGEVSLNPAEPEQSPRIAFNMLEHEWDRQRMVAGLRQIASLVVQEPLKGIVDEAFLSLPTPSNQVLFSDSVAGRLYGAAASWALGGPTFLRRRLLRNGVVRLEDLQEPGAFEAAVAQYALPGGHVCGTCRMGSASDPLAVTDSRGKVFGVQGLRVADTSLFPTLMMAGTNLPAIMTGERIARMILEERSTTAALPASSAVVRSIPVAKRSAILPGMRP